MTRQQEFRKQTEEAKFEAFSLMCKKVSDLEAQIEKMKCCENCAFFKEKTYDICHRIKKLGSMRCAFYKMI